MRGFSISDFRFSGVGSGRGVAAVLLLVLAGRAGAVEWSGALLGSAEAWSDRMNGAVVSAGASGLRVEIAPGRTWAIAAVPAVRMPRGLARIRVHVRELGGKGRWLMRLRGAFGGADRDISVFQGMTQGGDAAFDVHPMLLEGGRDAPAQLQLGLEGEAGAYVVFDRVALDAAPPSAAPAIPGQRNLRVVDAMPNLPQPFRMPDWRARARDYDRLVFDFQAKGEYLPLIWLDDSRVNIDGPTFGLPSYVGGATGRNGSEEGVNCIGAVLGATLVGIDKRKQAHDYVAMCAAYFNRRNGARLVLNGFETRTGGSYWYEIWPSMVFFGLADRYPGEPGFAEIVRATADRWAEAVRALAGPDGVPDFDATAFDFAAMRPVSNGQWKEPDAAAGVAWLEYAAWRRFGDRRYRDAAEACLRSLDRRAANPYYEVLLPWGTLTAARMNAELGRSHDVDRMLGWCFGISACRGGWGVTVGRWGGYDCSGLVGSVDNGGGYAFAMNTFAQAAALTPVARYDTRYARAIGKWMLNLASSARLFYPDEMPAGHRSGPEWDVAGGGAIAYEGLRKQYQGMSPCATGDPVAMRWGPKTDRGLYGSSYAGFLGAIVGRTSDARILALDCLATDFYHDRAYPTYLLFNPYARARTVRLDVGAAPRDVYDAVSGRFVLRNARGRASVTLPADGAAVLVLAPAGGKAARQGDRLLVNGVTVDYRVSGHGRQGDRRP